MSRAHPPDARAPGAGKGARWRAHLVAGGVLALTLLVGLVRSPDPGELRRRAFEGSAAERAFALLALSQRAPGEIDPDLIQALAADPDPRLREFLFTNVFSRHVGKATLLPLAERGADPGERWRARFWLTRDVASPERMTRSELEAYYDLQRSAPRDP